MALQKTIKLKNNFGEDTEIKNAYIKVAEVLFSKKKAIGKVHFYKDGTELPISIDTFIFDSSVSDNSKNAIAQGYEYLKTLPEFADAVDC
jgi:hypothetical protein